MPTDVQILDSLRCSRAEFGRRFLEAQIELSAECRNAFEAVAPAPAERDAFTAALVYANLHGFREELLDAIIESGLEDGKLNQQVAEERTAGGGASASLQAMIDLAKGFEDPHVILRGFAGAMRWTAKVLIDGQFSGTGFLVGPNLLMTAWHVVKALFNPTVKDGRTTFEPIEGGGPRLKFLFDDYLVMVNRGRALQRMRSSEVKAADKWHMRHSACHAVELNDNLPSEIAELEGCWDYALIRLAAAPGLERRWAAVSAKAVVPLPARRVFVFQHPLNQPMRVADAEIAKPADYGLADGFAARFLHRANTKGGSSGSPCFDQSFSVFGIHQGAWARGNAPAEALVNRGVPIVFLLADLGDLPEPDPKDVPIWNLAGAGKYAPALGRWDFQSLLWRATLPAGTRILTLGGPPGSGKTFLTRILAAMLADATHLKIVLVAETIGKLDVSALATAICAAAGAVAPDLGTVQATQSTPAVWRQDVVRGIVAAIDRVRAGRMVWLVVRDLNKGEIAGVDATDLLAALYAPAAVVDWLRIVLDGFAGDLPTELGGMTEAYAAEPLRREDVGRYFQRLGASLELDLGDLAVGGFANMLYEMYRRLLARNDPAALASLAAETLRCADALLQAAERKWDDAA